MIRIISALQRGSDDEFSPIKHEANSSVATSKQITESNGKKGVSYKYKCIKLNEQVIIISEDEDDSAKS